MSRDITKNIFQNEKSKTLAKEKTVPGVENIFKNIDGYNLTRGNYEAFAKPRKPADADRKKVYLIGGGIASLAAAAFLVRDAQVPGENITILESSKVPGGAMDGRKYADLGFIIRGGRELEEHYECM
jgi:myosin-crossreactive antigen